MAGFFDEKNNRKLLFVVLLPFGSKRNKQVAVYAFQNGYFAVRSLRGFARNVPNDENTPPAAKIQRKMIIY